MDDDDDCCSICLDFMIKSPYETLSCHHTFHHKCIHQWYKKQHTCPLCLSKISFSQKKPKLCLSFNPASPACRNFICIDSASDPLCWIHRPGKSNIVIVHPRPKRRPKDPPKDPPKGGPEGSKSKLPVSRRCLCRIM